MTYASWFERATGSPPFPYQVEFALAQDLPDQLSVPTGLGKTATAVLGWLWRRRFADPVTVTRTPRRLVFTLPVRTLVEQTVAEVTRWLSNLNITDVRVHALLGGAVDDRWDDAPDRDAILVGTQDQLLSRALNRGYAMSRFRWPVHFAWLHNDALWVFDEVQLMGVGASTGAQLQGLRNALKTHRPTHTLWMTATPSPGRLATVDGVWPLRALALSENDRAHPVARQRLGARKALERAPGDPKADPAALANLVVGRHRSGGRTLVVCNQVARAQAVFQAVRKAGIPSALLHSRFRPGDRQRAQTEALDRAFSGVIVATQAIEAGVDLSCDTLITEACPWSSFVQRAGRCNRYGEHAEARVVWVTPPTDTKAAAPYTPEALAQADTLLTDLEDVGPASLASIPMPDGEPELPVVRRRDLLGLFDTEADLSGVDLDVSAWIRDTDANDVQVAWRELPPGERPPPDAPAPQRDELCRVRIGALVDLLKRAKAWRWDSLAGAWVEVAGNRVTPGAVVVLPASAGGYHAELGFTGDAKHLATPVVTGGRALDHDDADGADPLSHLGAYVSLRMHSEDTAAALGRLAERLADADDTPWTELARATRWHDVGKAHPVFQQMLVQGLPADDSRRDGDLWAKSDRAHSGRAQRPHFRHELASALAFLEQGASDLEAYVVAAHHGKARLTIRGRPTERPDAERGRPILGVLEGDVLPAVDLGDGVTSAEQALRLDVLTLGGGQAGESWMTRMQRLLTEHGPFRLAWCESLVRVADWEASRLRVSGSVDAGTEADVLGGAS